MAVSRGPLTAEAQVHSQISREVGCGNSGFGAGFSPVSSIPLILQTYFHLSVAVRRTNVVLGISQIAVPSRTSGSSGWKGTFAFLCVGK